MLAGALVGDVAFEDGGMNMARARDASMGAEERRQPRTARPGHADVPDWLI